MRSDAAMAAAHASPPVTVTPAHELYAVALMPVPPAPSLLNTPALMYMLARIASAAPCVSRPLSPVPQVAGRPPSRAAINSLSMKSKSSRRVLQADFSGGDDRNATEHVQQDVIVESPQRPAFRDVGRLVRNGRVLHGGKEQICTSDARVGSIPG